MFEIILAVLVLFFFCWGLGEFLHYIKLSFFHSKHSGKNVIVSFLNEQTALKQTRKIIEKYRWYGTSYTDKVIFVCDNISEKTGQKISEIIDGDKNFYYCNKKILLHLISGFDEDDNEQSGTTAKP